MLSINVSFHTIQHLVIHDGMNINIWSITDPEKSLMDQSHESEIMYYHISRLKQENFILLSPISNFIILSMHRMQVAFHCFRKGVLEFTSI